MDKRRVVNIHEAADEAQKKLEPFSHHVGVWFGSIWYWITKQINRFRHSLALFGMAAILILVLTSGDIKNLISVVVTLIAFGVVWMGVTGFNFEADKQVPESAETAEVEEDLES